MLALREVWGKIKVATRYHTRYSHMEVKEKNLLPTTGWEALWRGCILILSSIIMSFKNESTKLWVITQKRQI